MAHKPTFLDLKNLPIFPPLVTECELPPRLKVLLLEPVEAIPEGEREAGREEGGGVVLEMETAGEKNCQHLVNNAGCLAPVLVAPAARNWVLNNE